MREKRQRFDRPDVITNTHLLLVVYIDKIFVIVLFKLLKGNKILCNHVT